MDERYEDPAVGQIIEDGIGNETRITTAIFGPAILVAAVTHVVVGYAYAAVVTVYAAAAAVQGAVAATAVSVK